MRDKETTNLKCLGCKCDFPEDTSDEAHHPTHYAAYRCCEIIEWICIDCWRKGVRYQYNRKDK